jgi:hypothetical protein
MSTRESGFAPRLQIASVGDPLDGKRLDIPAVRQTSVTYTLASKAMPKAAEQPSIFARTRPTCAGV